MATAETKHLDNIIASRRSMLLGGGAALAALAMPSSANAAATVNSYTDFDILNFALNLEYLEANFYYLAAFGTTINNANAASTAAGAAVIPTGAAGATGGTTAVTGTGTIVPFTLPQVKAYAIETAIEEGKHVLFLQNAIKSNGGTAVAQPPIDISPTVFNSVAAAASIGAPFLVGGAFNPYANDFNFLAGAYIFEDVGVTAYHGAAPLISTTAVGKAILQAASSILAVEAYHSGLIRTSIYLADPTNAGGYLSGTQKISTLRSSLAHATNVTPTAAMTASGGGTFAAVDDFGLYPGTYPTTGTSNPPGTSTVSLAGTASAASNIADADATNVIAFSRTTTQILNIVTSGGAQTVGTKAVGGFFPSGLNGTFV